MDSFLSQWMLAIRILGLTFRAQLEYRSEFIANIAFGIAWQLSVIVFVTVLLGRFPGMAGWSADAVYLIAAIRMLSHGLFAVFFDRHYQLATLVQEGRLDAFLLRPMPVYRQVQLAFFPSNALGDLLVGISMFTVAAWRVQIHWTAGRIGYVVASVIGATLMEGAVFTTLSCAHLHFPSAGAWSVWVEELFSTFGNYPLSMLPPVISRAFTYVLPLAFIAYLPAAILTVHTNDLGVPHVIALCAPLVGLISFVGSRRLWNMSLRRYTGVSG